MRMAVVVSFLNEERFLGTLLTSVALQTRPPDRLVLVDDGSTDRSHAIASEFEEEHPYAQLLHRPKQERARDRLVSGSVWEAFQWAVDQLGDGFDVVAKLDADLQLGPHLFEEIEARFASDAQLGLTGPYLSETNVDGGRERLRSHHEHVAGATKFYRRACYDDVYPLPPLRDLDMMDEVKARSRGWRTQSFGAGDGDPLHLRPVGTYDGSLRSIRRWGEGDYVSGSHPILVLYVGFQHLVARPRLIGGVNYFAGWISAAGRRLPRFDPELRELRQHEQMERARERVRKVLRRAPQREG